MYNIIHSDNFVGKMADPLVTRMHARDVANLEKLKDVAESGA